MHLILNINLPFQLKFISKTQSSMLAVFYSIKFPLLGTFPLLGPSPLPVFIAVTMLPVCTTRVEYLTLGKKMDGLLTINKEKKQLSVCISLLNLYIFYTTVLLHKWTILILILTNNCEISFAAVQNYIKQSQRFQMCTQKLKTHTPEIFFSEN